MKLSKNNFLEIAKNISIIENDHNKAADIIKKLSKKKYYVIGMTGSPGVGKSSLTDILSLNFLKLDKTAIIAVDPSSPFTGGAFLGDRIRMKESSSKGVFIRSLASRGSVGGLNPSVYDTVEYLGRSGFKYIIIETVGTGQAETDIKNIADMVLLVLSPGNGDEIQSMKAGIMEIGDIYVVNKSDLQGAKNLFVKIKSILDLSNKDNEVVLTSSLEKESVNLLFKKILIELNKRDNCKEIENKRKINRLLNAIMKEIKYKHMDFKSLEKIYNFVREGSDGRKED